MIQPCCTRGQKSLGHIKEQPLNAFLVQTHGEYILLSAYMWLISLVLVPLPSFRCMKASRVFLFPPGWDASPL